MNDPTAHGGAYAADGVNIEEGDKYSAFAGKVCKASFTNSPFVDVREFSDGHFRGPRGYRFVNLPDNHWQDAAGDGNGTKVIVTDAAMAHRGSARDLIAMSSSDILRWGGCPLVNVNVLDTKTLDKEGTDTNNAFKQMMLGLGEACAEERIVAFRGETAELGVCVGSDLGEDATATWNWAGVTIGVYLEDRMITGKTLAPRQIVVAVREYGFRSNGLSSARAALRMQFGERWWDNPAAEEAIKGIATPSALYGRLLTEANGWTSPVTEPGFRFHAISHISGGGIVGKFFEDMLVPRGLSAEIDNLWDPPEIMQQVVEWRGMPEEECYRAFNCGNGLLVALDQDEVDRFCRLAMRFGHEARACGQITRNKFADVPHMNIKSGFSGKWLPPYTSKKS